MVCPDISSPAQSLASVMNVPSNSCLPCRFCSFLGSAFGQPGAASSAGCLRVNRNAKNRHSSTISSPARNVNTLDNRKHHHLRSCRHSVFGGNVVACTGHCAQHGLSGIIVPRRGRPIRKHQRPPRCRWPAAAVANVLKPCGHVAARGMRPARPVLPRRGHHGRSAVPFPGSACGRAAGASDGSRGRGDAIRGGRPCDGTSAVRGERLRDGGQSSRMREIQRTESYNNSNNIVISMTIRPLLSIERRHDGSVLQNKIK